MDMMRRTLGRSLKVRWTSKSSQAELEAQSKSSSSLLQSLRAVRTKINAQAAYGVRFGCSLYGWKYNFKDLPMELVWGPNSFGVDGNHQNKWMSRIYQFAATPSFGLLARVSCWGPWWTWLGGYAHPNTHIIISRRQIRVYVFLVLVFHWGTEIDSL